MTSPPGFCTLDASQEASMGLEVLHEAAVMLREPTWSAMSFCRDGNTGIAQGKLLANPNPKQDGFCD